MKTDHLITFGSKDKVLKRRIKRRKVREKTEVLKQGRGCIRKKNKYLHKLCKYAPAVKLIYGDSSETSDVATINVH
jgi:hypothetical protein